MEEQQPSQRKRARTDSTEPDSDFPDVKRIREDLLGTLDNSDDRDLWTQDLDSVMRSFEEELSGSACAAPLRPSAVAADEVNVIDLTDSNSGETQLSELEYFLDALDGDLSLPDTSAEDDKGVGVKVEEDGAGDSRELIGVSSPSPSIGEFWPVGDVEITSYDSFGFGVDGDGNNGDFIGGNGNDYVALDGIFDYSDINFCSSDYSDFPWRPKSLPAL